MIHLKILAPIANFSVILLIGLRTLSTECFNVFDVNLSLSALVFSMIVEIIYLDKRTN